MSVVISLNECLCAFNELTLAKGKIKDIFSSAKTELGFTRTKLAIHLGVTTTHLQNLEKGKAYASAYLLKRLLFVLENSSIITS